MSEDPHDDALKAIIFGLALTLVFLFGILIYGAWHG